MTIKRSDLKELLTAESQKTKIKALEKIIDGNLLMLEDFPDPDHPDRNKNKVVVIFEGPMPTPAVQKALKAKYKKAGWNLEFGIDWRRNGPWAIVSYEESLDKRKQNIRERFEGYGHKLAPWEKRRNGWSTRCINDGCNLDFLLTQRESYVEIFTGSFPIQKPVSCPCK